MTNIGLAAVILDSKGFRRSLLFDNRWEKLQMPPRSSGASWTFSAPPRKGKGYPA